MRNLSDKASGPTCSERPRLNHRLGREGEAEDEPAFERQLRLRISFGRDNC